MNRETALLQLLLARGFGAKSIGRLLKRLSNEQRPIEDFVSSSAEEIGQKYGVKPDIAQSISDAKDSAQELSDRLYENEVQLIDIAHDLYPENLIKSLNDNAPPLLFTKGNISLLEKKAVGFCGSRRSSERGIEIAQECAKILSQYDINIVSGYAFGVDVATHSAALEAGGATTFVLADGIFKFSVKSVIQEYLDDDNYLIISEFPPELPWTSHNAMLRNSTICGLSDAVILIESGLDGGTFAAGKKALELQKPLFVVDYSKPPETAQGNEYFLKRGAYPLKISESGMPDLQKVTEVMDKKQNHSTLSLFSQSN